MTHIPDEAVQAALDAWLPNFPEPSFNEMREALTAALPHLSAPCAVEVRNLVFLNGAETGSITSYAAGVDYTIWSDFSLSINPMSPTEYNDAKIIKTLSIDEAKAAAQADFKRRILSCVVTKPVAIPTKEERHANTARNLIINQTSTDLEDIINGHDPEQSILNNDVWDRLDKMACEIEALAKPVDVAAVRDSDEENRIDGLRIQAFKTNSEADRNAYFDAASKWFQDRHLRALSAEPAQHPDDTAVDNFARLMKTKLARKREEGRSGWQDMSADDLSAILRQHVDKGDPVDVANLCMMLSGNGQRIAPVEPAQGARPLEEWHEDHGNVVWWAWDENRKEWLGEPAYIGMPIDSDWPEYHTHWTPHPMRPAAPTTEAGK